MKKTYIIPTVKTYKYAGTHRMIAASLGFGEGTKGAGEASGNENNLDDQESTPWYK